MEKINQGHPLSQSPDFVKENIELLKSLFPTIVKEGKIVMEELEALLGKDVEKEDEYYNFTWAGKSMARREANKPSTATLRPDKSESKDWDTTGNIFIEGDNLEVLKLLQKSYANKIKMIYIDPPYNTGKDFVYKDNYNDNLNNYLSLTGQLDEDGKKLSTNSESDGRYHSNWLNMMYPRLKLARNLLKENGLIFISIDDNEITNLRKISDEIFGEDNFISQIAWRKSDNQANIGQFARVKEYILCYSKSKKDLSINRIPLTKKAIKEYSYSDEKGKFRRGILLDKTRGRHFFEVKTKSGNILNGPWMVRQEDFLDLDKNNGIYWTSGGDEQPYSKIYLEDSKGQIPNDFWDTSFGSNQEASISLEKLMGKRVFDFPKSTNLIKNLLTIGLDDGEIVLDFFAGSGSTAHGVLELNFSDKKNRKFICIQLPEPTEKNSEAFKSGFLKISEITKERIRKIGEKIKSDKSKELSFNSDENLDIGFKVFNLDSSNIKSWDGKPDNLEETLFTAGKNIKEDRSEEDVLFEILLKYGLDLTVPIDEKSVNGKMVYSVGYGTLFICLSDNITTEIAEAIGQWKEELEPPTSRVIFKDSGFSDVQKTNSIQILKRFGINEVNTI